MDGRMGGRTDTAHLKVAFRNFSKAPKSGFQYLSNAANSVLKRTVFVPPVYFRIFKKYFPAADNVTEY